MSRTRMWLKRKSSATATVGPQISCLRPSAANAGSTSVRASPSSSKADTASAENSRPITEADSTTLRSASAKRSRRAPSKDETFPGIATRRRAILTHSPELHQHQARGFDGTTLAKATRQLDELAATLARGETRRPRPKVEAEITEITHDAWVRRVITWQLTGDTPRDLRLAWSVDEHPGQLTQIFRLYR